MKKTGPFAEVIIDLNARETDRVFHYSVPPEFKDKIEIGSRVLVPFGSRQLSGYIVGFGYPEREFKIKDIAEVLDEEPVFTAELLELARWMAENYLCTTAEAFSRILAPRLKIKSERAVKRFRTTLPEAEMKKILSTMGRAPKQVAVIKKAMECPGLTRQELAAAVESSPATVDVLVEKGLLEVFIDGLPRLQDRPAARTAITGKIKLNAEQAEALKTITYALERDKFGVFLLHGVTGSGKTEVYLQAIHTVLCKGRQAITLVPEISLTPQMVELFRGRFGDQVAVLHSALSDRERYEEWRRVRKGEASVVLGTRSAVFAPLPRPGLFIIDEEHESSYKQEDHLRYHAREVALKRAQLTGAVVVLGSATPSLESRLKATMGGPYRLLRLSERVDGRPLPKVRVVDLRLELKKGNRGIFSRVLAEAINERLIRGEQVLLFLNRRGYATVIICRECGLPLKCPRCDISLTYHLDSRLRCHYCNYTVFLPKVCPGCGSRYIRQFGVGTQRVEEEARKLFPGARIVRMDSDSTSRKGSHQRIFRTFLNGEADILVGTQMVAKGLNIPGVTLVGVINADTTLHVPDFRAAERTFQLLTQVAGRTGRGNLPGEVVIQTYCPDHYSIVAAAAHDCELFYKKEIPVRRSLGYPPFTCLARLLFTHANEEEVKKGAWLAKEILGKIILKQGNKVKVLGPAPAPLSKIKNRFRWQLILKGPHRNTLKEVIKELLTYFGKARPEFKPVINVDINPQGML